MDRYAVIGNPVHHSLSPAIHHAFAKQTQQTLRYETIESPLDAFAKTVEAFQQSGALGANVTLPFKNQAYYLTHFRSEYAEQAQAVNTLKFMPDGRIYADNTDGIGLLRDLAHNNGFLIKGKKILLLGAGGAARGLIVPLLNAGPSKLVVANRTMEKAIALEKLYHLIGPIIGIGLEEMQPKPYDLIINTTSAGLTGESFTLPPQTITEATWCYDLMYGEQGTPFLSWAKSLHPARCLDGIGMLVEQAAASFYLWRGVMPETQHIIHQLKTGKTP